MGQRLDDPRTQAARREPHWLYRLFDAEGHLLYIGQTRRPVGRFQGWLSSSKMPAYRWFTKAARVDWQRFPDYESVCLAEKRAIEAERPIHNRAHQPRRVA